MLDMPNQVNPSMKTSTERFSPEFTAGLSRTSSGQALLFCSCSAAQEYSVIKLSAERKMYGLWFLSYNDYGTSLAKSVYITNFGHVLTKWTPRFWSDSAAENAWFCFLTSRAQILAGNSCVRFRSAGVNARYSFRNGASLTISTTSSSSSVIWYKSRSLWSMVLYFFKSVCWIKSCKRCQ